MASDDELQRSACVISRLICKCVGFFFLCITLWIFCDILWKLMVPRGVFQVVRRGFALAYREALLGPVGVLSGRCSVVKWRNNKLDVLQNETHLTIYIPKTSPFLLCPPATTILDLIGSCLHNVRSPVYIMIGLERSA